LFEPLKPEKQSFSHTVWTATPAPLMIQPSEREMLPTQGQPHCLPLREDHENQLRGLPVP